MALSSFCGELEDEQQHIVVIVADAALTGRDVAAESVVLLGRALGIWAEEQTGEKPACE